MKDPELHKYFLTMCPTYTFIDRANGKFNGAMDFKREYAALMSYGWELDSACSRYLNSPDENTMAELEAYGIISSDDDSSYQDQYNHMYEYLRDYVSDEHPFKQRFMDNFFDG